MSIKYTLAAALAALAVWGATSVAAPFEHTGHHKSHVKIDRQRGIRIGWFGGPRRGDVSEAGFDVGVAQLSQVVAQFADGGERGEASLGIVVVLFQVFTDKRFQQHLQSALQDL